MFPEISDVGLILAVTFKKNDKIKIKPIKLKFNRCSGKTVYCNENDYFEAHEFNYKNIKEYNLIYKNIRTRTKNPRPIMYFNKPFSNGIRNNIWWMVVQT